MEKLCCSQEAGAFVVVRQAQLSQLNVGMFGVEDGGSPSILTVEKHVGSSITASAT